MPSFDIVSKTDLAEVDNAVQGMRREIETRFDFKGSKCSIERKDNTLTILADDDMKLRQMQELLKGYVTRRKLDAHCLDFKPQEKASGNTLRQIVNVKQGIESSLAKEIVKAIKDGKHMGAGRPILPPMPWFWYNQLPDDDLKAIYAYLKSIPAIANKVPPPTDPSGKPIS